MTPAAAETLQRAEAMIALRRPEEAVQILGPLLAHEPGDVRGWCLLAQAQLQAKRPADGLDSVGHALSMAPDSEWAHRIASLAHAQLNHRTEAVGHARESVRVSPESWRTHARLALAAAEADPRCAEAGQAAARAVQLAPDEAETHFACGYVAAGAGDDLLAEQAYRRCLQISPDHSAAQNNLGVIQLRRGRLVEGASGFASAAAADPRMDLSRRNIDVAARRLARRFHWVVLVVWFIVNALVSGSGNGTGALSGTTSHTGAIVAVLGLTLLGLAFSGWRLHQQLPPSLRSYLRTLPGRDRTLAAWLMLDLLALAALAAIPFVAPSLREALSVLAVISLSVGILTARLGNRARRRAAR